jgi:hypothetical protein
MRYLQQCITDLKTAHHHDSPSSAYSEVAPPPLRHVRDDEEEEDNDNDNEDGNEDEEMEDATSPTHVDSSVPKSVYQFANASPAIYPSDRSTYSYSTTTSPAILPRNAGHYSASVQSSDPHRYSLASSTGRSTVNSPLMQPSPAFSAHTPSATLFSNPFQNGPTSNAAPGSSHSAAPFSLTSPMLAPQADREDHEATEALLMLNTDRRSWCGGRGMSVKDLLSG